MQSLFDTVASIHARHVRLAQQAFNAEPIRMDLFELHSGLAQLAFQLLEDKGEIPKSTTTANGGAENPPKHEGQTLKTES